MNKKFFNGRRKKKKRKTRKKRGGNDEIIFEDMQGNDTFNKKSKYDIQVYMENNLLYKLIGKPVKKDNAFLYIELISYEQIYEPTFLLTLLSKTNESLALQLFETMLTEAIDGDDVAFGSLKIPIDENSYPLFNIKMNFSFIVYEPKGPMKSLEAPINLKCFKGRDLGFGRKKKTRKKKTRRKRRKKRDNAGCIPWRRRRRKKTKKIKTPSIDEIIKELSKSDSIDKEIADQLKITLKGRGAW